MQIHQTSEYLEILAPAKVNLYLEVLRKRDDGFHDVETVLCPITLFDRLRFQVSDSPTITLSVRVPSTGIAESRKASNSELGEETISDPAWDIPSNEQNLIVRILTRIQRDLGEKRGMNVELEKHIPAAAGLGGGSSDAAAAAVAGLHLWDHWNRSTALEYCQELGSDIAFFLGNPAGIGMAFATGRGECFDVLPGNPPLSFILTHPPVGCSTPSVYKRLQIPITPRSAHQLLDACQNGQFDSIGSQLMNTLQSPAEQLTEWIAKQLNLLRICGAPYTLMSGSGSCCFALTQKPDELFQAVTRTATTVGIPRVYQAQSWYAPSIEMQLNPTD